MKRLISLAAAAAMIFGAASCQKSFTPGQRGDQLVTFSVNIPDEVGTKARDYSDGTTVDELICQAFVDGQWAQTWTFDPTAPGSKKFVAQLDLVTGLTYDILFWAQKKGTGYYNVNNLTYIEAYYHDGKKKCNDEDRDAFYGSVKGFEVSTIATEEEVHLTRPFAQINFGSSPNDWTAAAEFVKENGLKSQVTVHNVPRIFDVSAGDVRYRDFLDIEFDYSLCPASEHHDKSNDFNNEKITYNNTDYAWIAMNYIFAPKDESLISTVTGSFIHDKNPNSPLTKTVINVPYKQNHRTNILGELFTGGNTFIVFVESGYENDYTVANPIEFAFETGSSITLSNNVEISKPLVLSGNKQLVVDLNGKTITASKDLWNTEKKHFSLISVENGATLTIVDSNRNGSVVARTNDTYTFTVRTGGTLNIEAGTYVGNITAVQVDEGTANIKGGHFSLAQLAPAANGGDERFTLNCVDANYKAGTAQINVTGGSFVNFNPAKNLAEGENTNFVAEGYEVPTPTQANGKTTYTVIKTETTVTE